MRREILFWILLASVIYSLIFAYISKDKKHLQYFFVLCSILQLFGAYSIQTNNIQSLESVHALMFIFCFIITLCIQSNIANLYTFLILVFGLIHLSILIISPLRVSSFFVIFKNLYFL